MSDLSALTASTLALIDAADTVAALEDMRVAQLGKKGAFTERLKTLGALPPDERKTVGAALNEAKQTVAKALDIRLEALKLQEVNIRLNAEWQDITLAPRPESKGSIHPVSHVIAEVSAIFAAQGFTVAEGPEIEDDYHNFSALNFPENHPARQMHDTFFLKPFPSAKRLGEGKATPSDTGGSPPHPTPLPEGEGIKPLLRTHTSPVQIRTMQAGKPPFRFIAPGKTYRCDSDMTHTPMFHQVEGFVVDRGIHMGHLKGCVEDFVHTFFASKDIPVRFRPSFFPFTEPSAEVDIGCTRSKDSLVLGAGPDWLEMGGCGMIHPNVLRHCNIDPEEWQGFAFGWGIDRIAMLKYGIPDLRAFFESDIRWLRHYGFTPFKETA